MLVTHLELSGDYLHNCSMVLMTHIVFLISVRLPLFHQRLFRLHLLCDLQQIHFQHYLLTLVLFLLLQVR